MSLPHHNAPQRDAEPWTVEFSVKVISRQKIDIADLSTIIYIEVCIWPWKEGKTLQAIWFRNKGGETGGGYFFKTFQTNHPFGRERLFQNNDEIPSEPTPLILIENLPGNWIMILSKRHWKEMFSDYCWESITVLIKVPSKNLNVQIFLCYGSSS